MNLSRLPSPAKAVLRYALTLPIVARSYLLAPFGEKFRHVIWLVSRHSKVGGWLGDVQKDWVPALPRVAAPGTYAATDVVLPFYQPAAGNVTVFELAVLAAMVRHYKPKRIFEIGTFNGLTTLAMAVNAAADTKIFTLDLPAGDEGRTQFEVADGEKAYIRKQRSGELFHRGIFPQEQNITQLYGDSATFDYVPYENSMDLVFVDGSHVYDYVLNDSGVARKLLRGGRGTIVWHDYNTYWPGVIRGLEELARQPDFAGLAQVDGTSLVVQHRD